MKSIREVDILISNELIRCIKLTRSNSTLRVPHLRPLKKCKGNAAGKCKSLNSLGQFVLYFNYEIARNPNNFYSFAETVAHEYAHAVDKETYRNFDHGKTWQSVFRFFGYNPSRCHDYDMAMVSNRFAYTCKCNTVHLTRRMHNIIQTNQKRYCCKKCRNILVWEKLGEKRQAMIPA